MQKLEWGTEKRRVNDLLKLDINPRKISESKKEELKKSIERFNLVDIPVLDKDDVIISGNQRVFILQVLDRGDEYIDVRVPNRKLTIKEKKEYALLANTHAGEFDFDILQAEFNDIDFDNIGFDFPKIGTDSDDLTPIDYSSKNKEIDTDDFADEMEMKFKLSSSEYSFIQLELSKINAVKENALLKLLNYES